MCVAQLGLFHLMPNLLKCFRVRVNLWLKLERWAETASDTLAALSLFIPYARHEQIPDELKQAAGSEIGGILAALRQLSPEQRAQLYAAAGEPAEMLRQLVEDRKAANRNLKAAAAPLQDVERWSRSVESGGCLTRRVGRCCAAVSRHLTSRRPMRQPDLAVSRQRRATLRRGGSSRDAQRRLLPSREQGRTCM